jgi:signal transduction histidine kinase/CheY-like chemotaxis protein
MSLWKRFVETNDPGDLHDLRQDLILEIGAGAIFVGWILMTTAVGYGGQPLNLLVAGLLFAGALTSIVLRGRNYILALYCLLGGLLAATALNKYLFAEGWAQFFYPITVVVSGLLVSNLSVFLIAALASLVCLGVAGLQGAPFDLVQVGYPILLIMMTAFASWLSSRQLHSVLGWLRSSYAQAREWLDQLRDERMAQARTIKYLEEAYVRIEKLNYLLLEARQAAEEARQLKAEFAANISHELRTPLNVIIGFSETMANAPETYPGVAWSPILRGDIDEIYRSSSHLLGLIDDILDLSALEVNRLGLNLEEAEIGQVVEDAAAVVRGLYQAKRLYLKIDTQPDLPPILIDAIRIRQVLINLLSNASRFTTSGGVTITTRLVDSAIQVSVTDTGIGIAGKDVARVFEEFGQVDGSIRRPHEGSGLGVPLSKRLVEMHGGQMSLESQVGQGTTFTFSLPWSYTPLKAENNALERELRQAPRPHSVVRKCILVAEAGPVLLHAMRRQLSTYDLVEVSSAAELPALIERHRPVALLVNEPDRPAPDVQGWWAAAPRELPVVRASMKDSQWLAQELGILDYLIKPISREQLLKAIQGVPGQVVRILIVDDDAQLIELFARMLASGGGTYTILKALSGEEALGLLAEQPVDLILLDLVLPGAGGLEVLRALKSDPALAATAVIMISAQYPEALISANPLALSLYRREHASLTETLNYLRAVVEEFPKGGAV